VIQIDDKNFAYENNRMRMALAAPSML